MKFVPNFCQLFPIAASVFLIEAAIANAPRPASCLPDKCFCEAIRPHPPAQPANAVSSLAFVVVGLFVFVSAVRLRGRGQAAMRNRMNSEIAYPALFALALVAVGLGSFAYHALLTFNTQFADVFGMYLIATFILIYNLERFRRVRPITLIAGYLGLNAVLAASLYFLPSLRRYLFAALIIGALLLERMYRRNHQVTASTGQLLTAIVLLALGFIIWIGDITRIVCSPHSWLQGHAIWHVLGAAASWYVYSYYRSEIQA